MEHEPVVRVLGIKIFNLKKIKNKSHEDLIKKIIIFF